MHTPSNESGIINAFCQFAKTCGVEVDLNRKISVGGLTFIPVIGDEAAAEVLAQFTFLRALRDMPSLRIHEPAMTRTSLSSKNLILPTKPAINPDINVAVFDGGIGNNIIDDWCSETIYDTGQRTAPKLLMHGSEVTSTILFGNINENTTELPRPYCNVDHFRVLDAVTDGDPDLFDVLGRITAALESKKYKYINLSLGPRIPIEDDEVNVWTSTLEKYLADGNTLATVAVGNDGELEDQSRIQPPADLVNALSVGASNVSSKDWERASYSCIGPGRSPGFVKPDGVAFGGSEKEPFSVYSPYTDSIVNTGGTSFASPSVLRTAIALDTILEHDISALTAKALMIHNIEKSKFDKVDVGWGRFQTDINEMVFCDDNEVTVIYNGELDPSQYVRIPIPFPKIEIKGGITLKATLCYSTDVDPEHPVNYTKSGLVVTFKPKGEGESSSSFFTLKKLFPSEQEFRADAHKWETTIHHKQNFRKDSLTKPCFDVVYQARDKGHAVELSELKPLKYTLIVTLSIKSTPDVYNAIRQQYQTLSPINMRQEVQIKV